MSEGTRIGKRWYVAVVCALALALVASGCGGDGKDVVSLVQSAEGAVLAEKTARLELRLAVAGTELKMDGAIDFAASRFQGSMELPVGAAIEMVQDGAVLYMRSGDQPWTKIEAAGALRDKALQAAGADPRAILQQLSKVGDITEGGTEQLHGTEVTKYSGDLDFAAALRASGVSDDQAKAMLEQVGDDATATIAVYLDEDGVAHRVQTSTEAQGVTAEVTMDLLDFGAPVDITIPSPSEVGATKTASTQAELQAVAAQVFTGG